MGFNAFMGGEDTQTLVLDSMASSFSAFAALTDALIETGKLDPNAVINRLGSINIEKDGSLPVAETFNFFMKARMEDVIKQERNRFRRMQRRAKQRGLTIERNASVLPYGSTGKEYVVTEGYFSIRSFISP